MTEPYQYDDSDTDDTTDNDSNEQRYVQLTRQQIRAMERDAKSARGLQEEVALMKRELAFAKVGAEFTDRQQKALLATIDGDITADSLREAAVDLGFTAAPVDSSQAEEQAALTRMSQASAGASDPGSEDQVARLNRVDREGGKDALLAQIQADGHVVVTSG